MSDRRPITLHKITTTLSKTMHTLWQTHEWQQAQPEEVVAALFNAPPFVDPRDMGEIKRFHPRAIVQYQQMFYDGKIPNSVRKIRQRSIGV
jgi:hypothetical protein